MVSGKPLALAFALGANKLLSLSEFHKKKRKEASQSARFHPPKRIPSPPPHQKMSDAAVPRLATTIHVTALDGIVNVNSLFTLAVFIGLAWNPNDPDNRLNSDQNCQASKKLAEDLVSFHVYSFSSFLFSSLIALCLKQAIRLARSRQFPTVFTLDLAHVNRTALRVGYLVSAAGSVSGCVFLMLALINVVQIKLGTLACGSSHSYVAVVPLVILVPLGLLIYVCSVLYAFTL